MQTCEERVTQIHRFVEGELSPEQEPELSRHLRECPNCTEQMREFSRMKDAIEETLDDTLAGIDLTDSVLDRIRQPEKKPGRLRPILRWAAMSLAATAAIFVLAAAGLLYYLGFIGPKPVAGRLTHVSVAGGEWKKNEKEIRGMTEVSAEGNERLALMLENGVLVILNEKTALEVQSVNQLKLLKGDIYVDTAKRKGVVMRVKTSHATALVTGTRLGVSAEEDETSVIVEEGKVTVDSGWGEQVVVYGNIFRIIQSMKPEPPEPINVEEMFFWVKERAHLTGMMIELYGQEYEEPSPIESDEALLDQVLYGLDQSREAIWSGDAVFDLMISDYGYDLTDEEQKEFLEHVVAGRIAQLDLKERPSEEKFREIVQEVVDSVVQKTKIRSSEATEHWTFRMPDMVRQDRSVPVYSEFRTLMLINGRMRYWPIKKMAESTVDEFPIRNHPAYLGRSHLPISELANPRLVRAEEVNGVNTYLLEADELGHLNARGDPSMRIVRLWVDPSRGYVVLKTRTYMGPSGKAPTQDCIETIAESFEEVSPGIFYPLTFIENYYNGEKISGETVLRKTSELVYTLREGEFNVDVLADVFDLQIPPDVPVREFSAEWMKDAMGQSRVMAKGQGAPDVNEYLRDIYDQLEQIRLYDDPTAPGSRKLVLNMNGKKLNSTMRSGGMTYAPAVYNGEIVGTRVCGIDPIIAADVPFLQDDIIYTLNGEPWKLRRSMDLILGLEGCIPIVNSGRPVTAGIRRHGKLQYVVLWID